MTGTEPVPDPTGVTGVEDLIERLKALRAWAGDPSADLLREHGATGSVDSFVAACLRIRDYPPAEVDRELPRWQTVVAAVAKPPPNDRTTALPVVDALQRATALLPTVPAAAPAPVEATQPAGPMATTRSRGPQWSRRRPVLLAGAAAVAVLIAGPLLVVRLATGDPTVTPAAAVAPASTATSTAPPTTSPSEDAGAPSTAPRGARAASGPASSAPTSAAAASPTTPAARRSTTPADQGPWSIVLDDSHGRFHASDSWRTGQSAAAHGGSYRYAEPVEASDPGWYRVDIPETGQYRVEVWFPADGQFNDRTPYVVVTTDGHESVHLSQRGGGGRWVTLGTFTLAAGDADTVAVSRWRTAGTGVVVADAIRITQV